MTTSPSIHRAHGLPFLSSQWKRSLEAFRPEIAATLRPRRRMNGFTATAVFCGGTTVPQILLDWMSSHDGQPVGSPPAFPALGLRVLGVDEMLELRRTVLTDPGRATFIPLFMTTDGQIVGSTGKPDKPLEYWEKKGKAKRLPSLCDLLFETMTGLGWTEPPAKNLPEAPLDVLLVELAEQLAAHRKFEQRLVLLEPQTATNVKEQLQGLVEAGVDTQELETWFGWHNGESKPGGNGLRVHPRRNLHVLSLKQVADLRSLLTRSKDLPVNYQVSWLPLMTSQPLSSQAIVDSALVAEAEFKCIVYQTQGPDRGRLFRANHDSGTVSEVWESLAHFVSDAVNLQRRNVELNQAHKRALGATSPEQLRVLALGGILAELNGERHDLIGGSTWYVEGASAAVSLKNFYEIRGPREVEEWVTSVLENAERAPSDLTGEACEGFAWDLGRVPFVVGKAYLAQYLDLDEAWAWLLRAAQLSQKFFKSWEAFGDAYEACRSRFNSSPEQAKRCRAALLRLQGSGGAWNAVPWALPIENVPPFEATVRELRVSVDGAGGCLTVEEALKQCVDGDRLVFEAGRYTKPLVPLRSIEMVGAEPGVVFAPSTGDLCLEFCNLSSGRVRNVSFEATAKQWSPSTAIGVSAGNIVRCDDCSFVVNDGALNISGGISVAILNACRVSGGGRAAVATNGNVIARRCQGNGFFSGGFNVTDGYADLADLDLSDSGNSFLYLTRATATVSQLHCKGSDLTSVVLTDNANLQLNNSSVEASKDHGIRIDAGCSGALRDVKVSKCAVFGVALNGAAGITGERVVVADTGGSPLFMDSVTSEVVMTDCQFRGSPFSAVVIERSPRARVRFIRCTLGPSTTWFSLQMGGSHAVLEDCVVESSVNNSVRVQDGSLAIVGGTFLPAGKGAIVACGSAQLRVAGQQLTAGPGCYSVWAEGTATVELTDCALESTKCAVGCDGHSMVRVIRGNAKAPLGALLFENSQLFLRDTAMEVTDGALEIVGDSGVAVFVGEATAKLGAMAQSPQVLVLGARDANASNESKGELLEVESKGAWSSLDLSELEGLEAAAEDSGRNPAELAYAWLGHALPQLRPQVLVELRDQPLLLATNASYLEAIAQALSEIAEPERFWRQICVCPTAEPPSLFEALTILSGEVLPADISPDWVNQVLPEGVSRAPWVGQSDVGVVLAACEKVDEDDDLDELFCAIEVATDVFSPRFGDPEGSIDEDSMDGELTWAGVWPNTSVFLRLESDEEERRVLLGIRRTT